MARYAGFLVYGFEQLSRELSQHCPSSRAIGSARLLTYSVGDSVLEAYEFYAFFGLFPFRPQGEYEVQGGFLRFGIVVEQWDVSDRLGHGWSV